MTKALEFLDIFIKLNESEDMCKDMTIADLSRVNKDLEYFDDKLTTRRGE